MSNSSITTAENIYVHAIGISDALMDMTVGEEANISAIVSPSNATNKGITWSSNNTNVATVRSNLTIGGATITAVGAGTATITVAAQDGSGVKATCRINVTAGFGDDEYHIVPDSNRNKALFVGDKDKNIFNLYPETNDKNIYVRDLNYRMRAKFKITGDGSNRKILSTLNEDYVICNDGSNNAAVSHTATDANSNLTFVPYGTESRLYKIKLTSSSLYLTYSNGRAVWAANSTSNEPYQIWKIQGKPANIHNGIDSLEPISNTSINAMLSNGEEFVCRYYKPDESTNSIYTLTSQEAQRLHNAGLSIVSVYQYAGNKSSEFNQTRAEIDAEQALNKAIAAGQPENTAIYFAVDYSGHNDLDIIKAYFDTVKSIIGHRYKVGVYGGGTVCEYIKQTTHVADYSWLSHSTDFDGYPDDDNTLDFNIKQAEERENCYGINKIDDDVAVGNDYGQW